MINKEVLAIAALAAGAVIVSFGAVALFVLFWFG